MLAPCLRAAPPEVRGTWLTTTGAEDHIRSGLNTAQVMSDLRGIGLNTAYVETWKNGYTNYPSPTMATFTGGPDRSTFLGTTRDLVQETSILAHRNSLTFHGWYEYGFSAQFLGTSGTISTPLAVRMRDNGWLLRDQAGRYSNTSNGYAWMNPAVPQVRQLLIDIVLEAVNRYDLDGIQFDDRLAWPREFGWDATTAAIYLAQTGRSLPSSVNDAQFGAWRQQKVTEFAGQLYAAVKAVRPDMHVSVSPSITGFAEPNYNADWTGWLDAGLFDEFVPQAYRDSLSGFNSIVNGQVAPFEPDQLDKLVLGLKINGTSETPYTDLQGMIQRTRTEGAAGHSIWYSRGVRDQYRNQLTSFYNVAAQGQAQNPFFAVDHRPAPLAATPGSASYWNVTVPEAGQYRIVARIGGYWTEVNTLSMGAGSFLLYIPGSAQVELLADRRPSVSYFGDLNRDGSWSCADLDLLVNKVVAGFDELRYDLTGDAIVDRQDVTEWLRIAGAKNLGTGRSYLAGDVNLDGVVDGGDFNLWNANKFQSASAWCRGDLNADGFVDRSDFSLWNATKFQSSDGGNFVPEPRSCWVLLAILWGCASRKERPRENASPELDGSTLRK